MSSRIMIIVVDDAVPEAEPTPGVPPLGRLPPAQCREESRQLAGRVLADAAELARAGGVRSSGAIGVAPDHAGCIATAARERSGDLIVVRSHGRDAVVRIKSGRMAVRLIPVSHVPVLACKGPGPPRRSRSGDVTRSPRG